MPFDVNDFKAKTAQRGFLQSNKYEVFILHEKSEMLATIVNSMRQTGTGFGMQGENMLNLSRDLSFRCTNATLPGLTLKTSDNNRMGLGVYEKMPYSGNFTDISLSFLCDKFGDAYNFWYAWFNYIFTITGQVNNKSIITGNRPYYTTEYKNNYAATILIRVYDNTGKLVINCSLLKAYPTSINDVALGWGDNNKLIKVNTTITFTEWAINDSNAVVLPSGINVNIPNL